MGACSKHERLPLHPALPADMFTACLTTPIRASLHYFLIRENPNLPLNSQQVQSDTLLKSTILTSVDVTTRMLADIPGKVSDRRTMLGELNWIFTAITDSIAWCALDQHLFKRLYRQDLLVAALFRNQLLARRVLKFFGCNPHTVPQLPDAVDDHYLWDSWDMVCEVALNQLPQFLKDDQYVYVNSTFFED